MLCLSARTWTPHDNSYTYVMDNKTHAASAVDWESDQFYTLAIYHQSQPLQKETPKISDLVWLWC